MSMKKLAVLSAVHSAQLSTNGSSTSAVGSSKDHHPQGYGNSMSAGNGRAGGRYETDLHGNVNILLGGAMLGGVVVVVFLVCYFCHRNMRKNRPHEYSQYWRHEPDVHSLEVFTMDTHAMCYERNGLSLGQQQQQQQQQLLVGASAIVPRAVTPGPPPTYESLIFKPCLASPSDKKSEVFGVLSPLGGCILPVPIDHQHGQLLQQRVLKEEESRAKDDEGLPSYEAALKLEALGYV